MKILPVIVLFWSPISALEFYSNWIKENLHLAEFFVYYGKEEEKKTTLREIFFEGCHSNNLRYVAWALQKQREIQFPISCLQIPQALEEAVQNGFHELLWNLSLYLDFSTIDSAQRMRLIETALELGYPHIIAVLKKMGWSLTLEQEKALSELIEGLNKNFETAPPFPINVMHHHAHGGDENKEIYQSEYRRTVAYVVYQMRTNNCNFHDLIENLGHRRRYMAYLCQLQPIAQYGHPTNQPMFTPYKPFYVDYEVRIREKYPLLPYTITAELNGKMLFLTQINENHWDHPNGEYRNEILGKLEALCRTMYTSCYAQERKAELAFDLGKLIWWMSHAPPFLRGTPTIISILMDAFCIYHNITPIIKLPDVNCEALLYDKEEEFALYMFNRVIPKQLE